MSGVLLFDDSPLFVSPDLAALLKEISPKLDPCVGAIVLQQVHYSIQKESGKIHNGIRYIFNSYKQWLKRLTWLSTWQIRQAFYHLRDLGLLLFEQLDAKGWNQRGYYTIDYEQLEALQLSICGESTNQDVDSPHIEMWTTHTSEQRDHQRISTNTCEAEKIDEKEKEATGKKKTTEDQPTSEEIDRIDRELRKLRINGEEVALAVRKHWKNAAYALEQVKRECNEGWVKKPIARFLKHITDTSSGDFSAAAPAPQQKKYPKPTSEQECELRKLGTLSSIRTKEEGYPEIVTVYMRRGMFLEDVLWWDALGIKVEDLK